ncbi:hypothetical protein [Micromonospora sp. CPCC 205561]
MTGSPARDTRQRPAVGAPLAEVEGFHADVRHPLGIFRTRPARAG